MTTSPCMELASTVSGLYECEMVGEYYRVFTPYMYPDGDSIGVYIKSVGDSIFVTDHGETMSWLLSNTMAHRLNKSQLDLFDRIARTHGVELIRGCISHQSKIDTISDSVSRVAQAASRASDISFTYKPHVASDIVDNVADIFDRNGIAYEQRFKTEAKSGHNYRVDFRTTNQPSRSLINLLGAPANKGTRTGLYRVFTLWSELAETPRWSDGYSYITVFDDRTDAWTSSDYDSLRSLSDVYKISESDRFVERVMTAA